MRVFGVHKIRWTIGRKIPVLMVCIAALSCGAVATFSGMTSFSATKDLIGQHLSYIAATKQEKLAAKLSSVESETKGLASTRAFVQLFDRLSVGFKVAPKDEIGVLSAAIAAGGNVERAATEGLKYYLKSYQDVDTWLRPLSAYHGYSAIMLVNSRDELIYSSGRDALGLLQPSSAIAGAINQSKGAANVVMTDFSPPSGAGPGQAFFVIGVDDPINAGQRAGTLLIRVSTDMIDDIMHDGAGFGSSGEAVVAGKDGILRSTSRFSNEALPPMENSLLSPGTSFGRYRNQDVLAATETLNGGGQTWSIIALEPTQDVFAPAISLIWSIMLITAMTAVITLAVAVIASRSISRPIEGLVAAMKKLAAGDTGIVVDGTSRLDETGDMSRAVLVFRDNAIARAVAEADTLRAEQKAELDRIAMEADRQDRLTTQAAIVSQIGDSLAALANGILSRWIEVEFPEGYGQIKDDFNNAVTQLNHTIQTVRGRPLLSRRSSWK